MTVTIKELREAVASAVDNIEDVRATALVTDQINAPQAVVYRKPWTFDEVMHGPSEDAARTYLFGVTCYVARTNERVGQELLDELAEPLGDKSVKEAVETDEDLNALCDWALVTDIDEIKIVTIGQIDYLSQDFTVQVATSP